MTINQFLEKHKKKTDLNEAQLKSLLKFKTTHSVCIYENFLLDLLLSKFISSREHKDLINLEK